MENMNMDPAGILEIKGQGTLREYVLSGGLVTLGRAADNAVVLDDTTVSRHHACIEWIESQPHMTDLGSANGTTINNAKIPPNVPRSIKIGDSILISNFQLSLHELASGQVERMDVHDQSLSSEGAAVLTRADPGTVTLSVNTPQWSKSFPIQEKSITIGRDPSNDIRINLPVVSRQHAKLEKVAHGYLVVDLGSSNGLTYHDKKISRMLLANGDILRIADDIILAYEITPSTPEVSEKDAQRLRESTAKAPVQEPVESMPAPLYATMVGVETPVSGLQNIEMHQRTQLTIGRSPENDLQLSYPTISRHHARITRLERGGQYVIEDLGSSNGTLVNHEFIESHKPEPLLPGQTIRIGPIKFIFEPESIQLVDESSSLRMEALHLNQFVSKDVNLLQDISLAIHPREFVAVVGVSGAGKSTLLNALSGLWPASDGIVLVNEIDLYRHFDAFRTDLGYVPQDDIIHKELTAERALNYAARLRLPSDMTASEREQAVREELETMGLQERKDVRVGSLSGGQRKRVSIGVERLTRPGLFFLDEATSGLDPGTENRMMRLLRQLADDGQTILLVTHATKNVTLCDLVVFLAKGGQLAYFGPPEEALEYFDVTDFDGIYERLEDERSPQEWADLYRDSPQYREYIVKRLQVRYGELLDIRAEPADAQLGGAARRPDSTAVRIKPKRPSGFRQLTVLIARYLDIIRSDRANLLLLLLIAPLLGLMDLIAWPRETFDPVLGDASRAMVMLFLASIVPFLVGALSSVREIVKERAIYLRERMVNLRIIPYVSSKTIVGLLFALYHAAALLILKLVSVDFTHLDVEDIGIYYLILVLAVMSGVMWGLLISAIAPREEQAMLLVIIVVVIQIVFSGGMLSLDQLGKAGEAIGYITSSKWALEAMVDVTQVERGDCDGPSLENCLLPGLQAYDTDAEKQVAIDHLESRFSDVLEGEVYTSIVAQLVIILGLFTIVAVIQKRKDVI
jgi:ABC-type multidrug transport system ATPase subunit/pSer/pThr/pTyr-binding forkhead associated (FHA) protein